MLFIAIAAVIAVAVALVSVDAGAIVGLDQTQTAQALGSIIILMMLASSLLSRRMQARQLFNGAVLWVGLFALVMVGYAYRYELQSVAGRVFGELTPASGVVSTDGSTVTFQRGMGRSFFLDSTVNGTPVKMVFDTGASAVVLTYEDALRIGLHPEQLSFSIPVQTANGVSQAAGVRLSQIRIGNIERANIPAFVAAQGMLETSLLGMTFLETLDSFSVSQNALELKG